MVFLGCPDVHWPFWSMALLQPSDIQKSWTNVFKSLNFIQKKILKWKNKQEKYIYKKIEIWGTYASPAFFGFLNKERAVTCNCFCKTVIVILLKPWKSLINKVLINEKLKLKEVKRDRKQKREWEIMKYQPQCYALDLERKYWESSSFFLAFRFFTYNFLKKGRSVVKNSAGDTKGNRHHL